MVTVQDVVIYYGAPSTSVPAKAQVYPVRVMHGSLRYVTANQQEKLVFWRDQMSGFVGVPFLAAVVALVPFRKHT